MILTPRSLLSWLDRVAKLKHGWAFGVQLCVEYGCDVKGVQTFDVRGDSVSDETCDPHVAWRLLEEGRAFELTWRLTVLEPIRWQAEIFITAEFEPSYNYVWVRHGWPPVMHSLYLVSEHAHLIERALVNAVAETMYALSQATDDVVDHVIRNSEIYVRGQLVYGRSRLRTPPFRLFATRVVDSVVLRLFVVSPLDERKYLPTDVYLTADEGRLKLVRL